MIKRNYYKIVRVFPDPSSYFYIKNETMSEGQLNFNDSWLPTVNLEYSFDKVNWRKVDWNIYIPADGYMYLRNNTGTFCSSDYTQIMFPYFSLSIGGDIRTLFNYIDVDSVTAIPEYGFSHPFSMQGDSKITDISNLSFRGITEIGNYGLNETFGWDHIGTKGVDLRDVTTLGKGALNNLYYDNSNLKEAYAPNVSTWNTSKTSIWLNGVASTGVVYKPSTLTIPTNSGFGIPSGWTTQDYPEE
jgi:hypothetical protein